MQVVIRHSSPVGYMDHDRHYDIARGRYSSRVMHLEQVDPADAPTPRDPPRGVALQRWHAPPLDEYLELFHRIGDRWLWHGRLVGGEAAVAAWLADPGARVFRLMTPHGVAGLAELDATRPAEVEIAYFGLCPEWQGRGLGGYLMRAVLAEAWRVHGVERIWLHTCSEDHPDAVDIYRHLGFRAFHEEVEWVDDPRLLGLLPRSAGPHVPIPE